MTTPSVSTATRPARKTFKPTSLTSLDRILPPSSRQHLVSQNPRAVRRTPDLPGGARTGDSTCAAAPQTEGTAHEAQKKHSRPGRRGPGRRDLTDRQCDRDAERWTHDHDPGEVHIRLDTTERLRPPGRRQGVP